MTPLHHIGDALREVLQQVPLGLVRVLFIAVPVVLAAWLLNLPQEQTAPAASAKRGGDLKLWASLALAIQLLIYLLL